MSLQSDFGDLINDFETYLSDMGVSDAEFDSSTGLIGLADKILDVEGSIGGIILSTSISCNVSSTNIHPNDNLIINGKLNASFDDISQSDEDLIGFIQHGTVKIYNGNTLLDTVITDNNGEYTCTYVPTMESTLSIKSVYEGNEYYTNCYSNSIIVNVEDITVLKLSSDKDVLSYYDEDTATVTASLIKNNIGLEGRSIKITLPCGLESTSKNLEINTWTPIGAKYKITTLKTNFYFAPNLWYGYDVVDEVYFLTTDSYNTGRIAKGNLHDFVMENGILYYYVDNTLKTYDAQNKDLTQVKCSSIGCVVEDYGGYYGTQTTDANGEYIVEYESQGAGNVRFSVSYGNLTDEYVLEDCLYYNDGSRITGFEIENNVSCTSDGEWITITKNTSGEKLVVPPRPLCCFNSSDNWELSFKCDPVNFNNQAFGVQMHYCSDKSYIGGGQYTSWSNSFNNCMNGGNVLYNITEDTVITFRRDNGTWKIYANNFLLNTKSYSWSNSSVLAFYTNNGRIQHLKEIKYKLL